MRAKLKATHQHEQSAASACRKAEAVGEWEFYGVPVTSSNHGKSSSRALVTTEIRPIGALREMTDGIEILFFPD